MLGRIPESDWKKFRKLRETALQRLCQRILTEVGQISADDSKSWHERYLEVYRKIQDGDEDVALMFNNPRRSQAAIQLVAMKTHGLVTEEELEQFSDEVRLAISINF